MIFVNNLFEMEAGDKVNKEKILLTVLSNKEGVVKTTTKGFDKEGAIKYFKGQYTKQEYGFIYEECPIEIGEYMSLIDEVKR